MKAASVAGLWEYLDCFQRTARTTFVSKVRVSSMGRYRTDGEAPTGSGASSGRPSQTIGKHSNVEAAVEGPANAESQTGRRSMHV